ncbi:MAG: ECF transporter S component [Oscillospiraceae bacterium]|nr:ECF transporter S component [Oscillospiraceae bacterium]MDY3065694.1 ECF transporter S component [Oscillospiraceae bacterium]
MENTNGKKKPLFGLYDIVMVGVMAAIVFVLTYFVKIQIPTPTGPVMFKTANIFILLSGLLLGGVRGGLAAGIGSMIYDLLDPAYVTESWVTFIRFFLVAFICGVIAYARKSNGENKVQNIIAAAVGAFSSVALYAIQCVVKLMITGSSFSAAFFASLPKLSVSAINAVIALVFAVILVFPLRAALKRAGVYQKLSLR